jgi:hypothetical protein
MTVDKFTVRRVVSFAMLALVGWWALSLIAWGAKALTEPPHYSCDTPSVEVKSGDTIYSIVRRHCSGDTQFVTTMLVKMYGASIDTWQTLHLPTDSPRP